MIPCWTRLVRQRDCSSTDCTTLTSNERSLKCKLRSVVYSEKSLAPCRNRLSRILLAVSDFTTCHRVQRFQQMVKRAMKIQVTTILPARHLASSIPARIPSYILIKIPLHLCIDFCFGPAGFNVLCFEFSWLLLFHWVLLGRQQLFVIGIIQIRMNRSSSVELSFGQPHVSHYFPSVLFGRVIPLGCSSPVRSEAAFCLHTVSVRAQMS